MAKSSGGSSRGGGFTYPKAPAGASSIVREAYTSKLSQNRNGLTDADKRMLAKGVKAGNLALVRGELGNAKTWHPIITVNKTGAKVVLS